MINVNRFVYSGESLNVSTGTPTISDISSVDFSTDGKRLWIMDLATNRVFQFDLPIPFSLKSGNVIYNSVFFDFTAQDTLLTSFRWNPSGTRCFVMGTVNKKVTAFNAPTPFDLTGIILAEDVAVNGSLENIPASLDFSPDGMRMFVAGVTKKMIEQFNLPTSFVLTGAVAQANPYSVLAQDQNPDGLRFSDDGLQMFVCGGSTRKTYQYALTLPFSVASGNVAYNGVNLDISAEVTVARAMDMRIADTRMFIGDTQAPDTVYQYDLTPDIDITKAVYTTNSFFSAGTADLSSITFRPDGLKMYILDIATDNVFEFDLTIPFSMALGNVVYNGNFSNFTNEETNPTALRFNSDGLKLFIIGTNSDNLHEYHLSTAYDITSVSTIMGTFNQTPQGETAPATIEWNADGTKVFILGLIQRTVFEYTVSVPFTLGEFGGNVSYSTNSFEVNPQETVPETLRFSKNGFQMFVAGGNQIVYQYELTLPYSMVTGNVVYSGKFFDLSGQTSGVRSLAFSTDEEKMFAADVGGRRVYEYSFGALPPVGKGAFDRAFREPFKRSFKRAFR